MKTLVKSDVVLEVSPGEVVVLEVWRPLVKSCTRCVLEYPRCGDPW